jgi:hypothetical protein
MKEQELWQWVKESDPAAGLWREAKMKTLHAKIMTRIDQLPEPKAQTQKSTKSSRARNRKTDFSSKRAGL